MTQSQLDALGPTQVPFDCTLDNGRILRSVDQREGSGRVTLEQAGAAYLTEVPLQDEEIRLVTTPSNPYADLLRDEHSYCCVLHPSHRSRFGKSYVAVRNILLEENYVGLHAVVAVRPKFDVRVARTRVVLDSTTHAAIGLPQGEPVGVQLAGGRAPKIRAAVFGNRHCVARVGRTATVDIEKAITRLPEDVFDVLDIRPNERIVVEALGLKDAALQVNRTTLRALPWRQQSPLLVARAGAGVPDYQELVGDEDFPMISLDLVTRQRLGIKPGTAVYLRPAVSSELARQFTTVSLALVAATISAAILRSLELALAMGALYIVLIVLIIARRLRQ